MENHVLYSNMMSSLCPSGTLQFTSEQWAELRLETLTVQVLEDRHLLTAFPSNPDSSHSDTRGQKAVLAG